MTLKYLQVHMQREFLKSDKKQYEQANLLFLQSVFGYTKYETTVKAYLF